MFQRRYLQYLSCIDWNGYRHECSTSPGACLWTADICWNMSSNKLVLVGFKAHLSLKYDLNTSFDFTWTHIWLGQGRPNVHQPSWLNIFLRMGLGLSWHGTSVFTYFCAILSVCFSPLQGPGTLAPEPFSILDLYTNSHCLRAPLSQELLVCFLKSLSICGAIAGSSNWPPKFLRNYPQLLRGELNPQSQSYLLLPEQSAHPLWRKERGQRSGKCNYLLPRDRQQLDLVLRRLLCWTLFLALYPHLVTPFFMVASWRACSLSFSMSLSVLFSFSAQSLPAWLRMGVFRPGSGCKISAGICLSSQELVQPDQDTFPFFLCRFNGLCSYTEVCHILPWALWNIIWLIFSPASFTNLSSHWVWTSVVTTPPKFPRTCAAELFSFCGEGLQPPGDQHLVLVPFRHFCRDWLSPSSNLLHPSNLHHLSLCLF